MRTPLRLIVMCVVTACFMGCPPEKQECIDGTEDVCGDAGSLPPDFCETPQSAEADSVNCHLEVTTGGEMNRKPISGVFISRLPDAGIDQDWYFAPAPGGLTPRSLLHINGGYTAPQSAVNFSVNVLKETSDGGMTSIATAIDKHGPAAPRPVDVIVPFGESNARLFALVADEGASGMTRVDNRNTYSLYMEIIENPDPNEPNDMTPTPIALAGSPAMGTQTGFLATNDDVDQFSFQVSGTGRQIIYLHITEMGAHPMNPPPPYRLSYTLFDPADRPIAEGAMANEFLTIDLATARLAPMTGTYRVQVKGFRPAGNTLPIRGDLRVQYQVAVQLLPDLDTQEGANGNDTVATAKTLNLAPNGRVTINGKISYVPDEEWFSVSLPSRGSPSTLRYRVTVDPAAGRFAPLSSTPARQIRVVRQVTMGATAVDRQVNCRTNATACFRGEDTDPMLVDALCNASDPPQCLYAQRNEELPRIPNLRNLVGAVPVFAGQQTDFMIMIRDEGTGADKYADDKTWTLDLEWVDDADEAARTGGPTMMTVGSTTSVATGELTFGYGKVFDPEQWFMQPGGLRGIGDYDAYVTDRDLFQFNLGGAMGDQAWEISWELLHADGGTRPAGDIALEFTFCNGTGPVPDGGLCAGQQTRIFGYNDESLTPWYLPMSFSNGTMLFSRNSTPSSTTITALPIGCTCLSAARATSGFYFANIAAIDRVENDPIRYRISQRMLPYPASGFTGPDGGTATCPVVDGGCGFAR